MTFTAKQVRERNESLSYLNRMVRVEKQNPIEAFEDATNLELGPWPGSLLKARRLIAPWVYA